MRGEQRPLESLQDTFLRLLGAKVDGRAALVASMLHRGPSEATSYWLQLIVAVGIATFGLVLGSSAVIIGAMLVAPLMGPILALAMGLAAGSPFLVLRAGGRILLSVVVGVGGAAGITALLPYHELTQELSARVSPTALDLLTAGFCALAGVYASLRPGSDTAATAAGTSIGISLVPPLCASGYALGIGLWSAATGAALLFVANLVAIIFVGTLMFAAAGFTRVATASLDREELARAKKNQISTALARRLTNLFESRLGPLLRFSMPLVLLAAVYVPLRRALNEVAWEVRARAEVQAALKREPRRIIESRVRLERRDIEVQLVMLGSAADAEAAQQRLSRVIAEKSGASPRVEVFAVPDAQAFAGLESNLSRTRSIPAGAELARDELQHEFESLRADVLRVWPSETAGEPLSVGVEMPDRQLLRLRIVHIGAPLGPDGVEALRRSLRATLGRDVELVDAALPKGELNSQNGELQFAAALSSAVAAIRGVPNLRLCVTEPELSEAKERDVAGSVRQIIPVSPEITIAPGAAWSARIVRGSCPSPDAAGIGQGGAKG